MPNVMKPGGGQLDSAYLLDEIQSVKGLILESWGPSSRNPDYNAALDVLLGRLAEIGMPYISINLVSGPLRSAFPSFLAREIRLSGSTRIRLGGAPSAEIRKDIGRAQAKMKVDPSKTGGNRTKRILLHNPIIDGALWEDIAQGRAEPRQLSELVARPTCRRDVLDACVDVILASEPVEPAGNLVPRQVHRESVAFERDPRVKAWVLRLAGGSCELCGHAAPFLKDDGAPYLEVHHLVSLSADGADVASNTVALCPNCHMRMHYGSGRRALLGEIADRVARLDIGAVFAQ
jgi:5-methylcytosine-specific restriction enzyme A